ncbi:MAG: hypothetical protein PHQ35_10795 [Phycisphaerae bacterium]|nr:hypothetical protein [Phycisphaerae bacterium]
MKIDTVSIRDLSDGIIQKVGDELAPAKAVNFAQNLRFDKVLGRAVVRAGTALVGAQIANDYSILGLHQFILSSGTKYFLAVIDGAAHGHINRLETGTWTEKTPVMTAATKVRFLTYLDTCVALNGTVKFASEDGSSWVSADEATPTACTAALVVTGTGNVDAGVHSYKITYINAVGETEGGAVSNSVTNDGSNKQNSLTSIPVGSASCTSRKIYRNLAGGSIYYYLATVADNSTTTYTDNIADATILAAGIICPTSDTTGSNLDIGNFPLGKFAIEWNDRVYTAGLTAYPDRLYYTSTPTNYIVSWTGAGSGYIDVEPYEGQGTITALAKVPGYILIFKERVLKRWNGRSTYPDDLCKLGTNSHESVVLGKRTAYYFSSGYAESVGFYETNGEETRKISRPIQEIVEAIASANYDDIAGFSDGESIMWSIGDITWDTVAYTNAVVMYHIDTRTWTLLTFPSEYKVFSQYISGTDLYITAGDDDGQVIQLFTGTTDNITGSSSIAISYSLQYHPMDLGSRSLMKELTKIIPHTEDLTSAGFSYRIDKKTGCGFTSFGTVSDNYNNEFNGRIAGHAFEFRYSGSTSVGGEIIGFDLINPEVALSIKY